MIFVLQNWLQTLLLKGHGSTPPAISNGGMPTGWDRDKLDQISKFLFEKGSVFKKKPNEKYQQLMVGASCDGGCRLGSGTDQEMLKKIEDNMKDEGLEPNGPCDAMEALSTKIHQRLLDTTMISLVPSAEALGC